MTTSTNDFDLLDQPWISAIDTHGTPQQLSLRDVFAAAHDLSAITGELPTQAFAILRLLLTVLRRSVAARPGSAATVWEDLWRAPILPVAEIDEYLARYADRFHLLDPEKPFFQVAGLRSAADAVSGLDRVIADVPNGEKYFTTRAGEAVQRIGFAEAARWVVHVHAFDPSGIKTGAVGDARVKNNKGYPIGVAWTGNLGGVFVEGATVRETLLLNLVLLDTNGARFDGDDLPVWERDPYGPAQRQDRRPAGPADLCTWQSRRVRLVHDGAHVTGVVLCNGDALDPANQHLLEPMTAWRYSPAQTKKSGRPQHYPMTHDPRRALWRGFASLIAEVANTGDTQQRAIAAGVMEWIRYLLDEEALSPTHPVRLHATGMQYINNQSVVGDIFDDTLGFRVGLLSSDPDLRTCAIGAVQVAEDCVEAIATLAGNLALAAGGDSQGARDRARERSFFDLEAPYRRWLAGLAPRADQRSAPYEDHWQQTVRTVIEPVAHDLVSAAGAPAWVGREVQGRHLDTGLAQKWFHARLRRTLPAAYPRTTTEKEPAA
ncbi:type I-E CRISPR-associated protein Cse1/CasA [Nocardia sp. alder85J]|uniref:type I-E CRISPR-associated protein Cse1/CasA n=1 Tax=Nocardia sp. alder85J TaxID=2862949 RepID=UPI001CD3FB60|nr:type I-E CRISPR-associated protein Cse1/CasA [Nocardia sp. alder85J]MCX4097901.1 type I-E CRISPR-associated protein Cse1/CasA [Nocardia sp. alder85J]